MTLYKVVEKILCVIKLLCEVNPFHGCHFSSRTCIFNDYTMHDQPISFWCYLMNHRKRHTELSIIVPTTPNIPSIQQNHTGLVIPPPPSPPPPPPPPVIEIINCRICAYFFRTTCIFLYVGVSDPSNKLTRLSSLAYAPPWCKSYDISYLLSI